MSASKKKKSAAAGNDPNKNERSITQNRKARHNFEVLDTLECGLELVGSEVKSLRAGRVSLDEAYARIRNGEVWLVGCDIAEYTEANQFNHDRRRPRKLLLHRREIRKFAGRAHEEGLTLVPLKMYFKRGRAKLLLGLCRGRKRYDKREVKRKEQVDRGLRRAMMRRR
jgi:SsrA-binding protein